MIRISASETVKVGGSESFWPPDPIGLGPGSPFQSSISTTIPAAKTI
ncbi:hypothetical protein [Leptospira bouyouniensis]|nr:hypothetical protein [Leptospira bouyouniensis]